MALSEVRDNARAGVAASGSALTLEAAWLSCNELDVVAVDTPLTDEGDNACGCSERLTQCTAAASKLPSVALPALPELAPAH